MIYVLSDRLCCYLECLPRQAPLGHLFAWILRPCAVTCSGQVCLPRKLSRLMSEAQEASRSGQQAAPSMAAALADMFPTDIQALMDVSGKKHLHTVTISSHLISCRPSCMSHMHPAGQPRELAT